jgi:hypothetical protein
MTTFAQVGLRMPKIATPAIAAAIIDRLVVVMVCFLQLIPVNPGKGAPYGISEAASRPAIGGLCWR